MDCNQCHGTGKVNGETCPTCNGTGKMPEKQEMQSAIKHGTGFAILK